MPWLTLGVVLACCGVFFWQIGLSYHAHEAFVLTYGLRPSSVFEHSFLDSSLLTHAFLHGGWGHLFFNMFFLWSFGKNVEDAMGLKNYLLFYAFVTVLSGLFGYVLLNQDSGIPLVGASGAVSGLMAAYLILFTRAKTYLLVFFVPIAVPCSVFVLGWLGLQILNAVSSGSSNVAWEAHIAGFFAGLGLTPFFTKPHVPYFGRGGPKQTASPPFRRKKKQQKTASL